MKYWKEKHKILKKKIIQCYEGHVLEFRDPDSVASFLNTDALVNWRYSHNGISKFRNNK